MGNLILVVGIASSIANAVLYSNNDPAMWGWISSAMWATGLLLRELFSNK